MITRAVALLACFLSTWALLVRTQRPEPLPLRSPFAQFPAQVGEWRGVRDQTLQNDVLAVLGADDYITREYVAPDRSDIGLYIGYWSSQRQGDTIHSPLNCLPGAGWEPVSKGTLTIPVSSSLSAGGIDMIAANRYVVEKGAEKQLVLYWYQSHGRVVASEYWSRLYLIRDAIRLNRTDGAIVRIVTPAAAGGEGSAEQAAVRFVKQLFPLLGAFLPT